MSQSYTFLHEDLDNCRSYYRGNDDGRLYCWQDDSTRRERRVVFYVCTRDGEPNCSFGDPLPDYFDRFVDPSRQEETTP